jgi:hypothetical protein
VELAHQLVPAKKSLAGAWQAGVKKYIMGGGCGGVIWRHRLHFEWTFKIITSTMINVLLYLTMNSYQEEITKMHELVDEEWWNWDKTKNSRFICFHFACLKRTENESSLEVLPPGTFLPSSPVADQDINDDRARNKKYLGKA